MVIKLENFSLRSNETYVELYKVLKALGLTDGGAEAKHVVSEGLVKVNGNVETRKRNKLLVGDRVEFNGQVIDIVPAE